MSTVIYILNLYLNNVTLRNNFFVSIYRSQFQLDRMRYIVGFEKPAALLFPVSVKCQRIKGVSRMC